MKLGRLTLLASDRRTVRACADRRALAFGLHLPGLRVDGLAQHDDAYLGGERSGGKAGQGSENKVPFVAACAEHRGRQAAPCLPGAAPIYEGGL